jgi:hypothetical protein
VRTIRTARGGGRRQIPIRRWPPTGDAVPADLLSGDIQALPPDAQAAAQSLAQDLDGMPPEILQAGRAPAPGSPRSATPAKPSFATSRRQARCDL